jgi:hypothetical protein
LGSSSSSSVIVGGREGADCGTNPGRRILVWLCVLLRQDMCAGLPRPSPSRTGRRSPACRPCPLASRKAGPCRAVLLPPRRFPCSAARLGCCFDALLPQAHPAFLPPARPPPIQLRPLQPLRLLTACPPTPTGRHPFRCPDSLRHVLLLRSAHGGRVTMVWCRSASAFSGSVPVLPSAYLQDFAKVSFSLKE